MGALEEQKPEPHTYFVRRGDEETGPFTMMRLRQMWSAGEIDTATKFRRRDWSYWADADELIMDLEFKPSSSSTVSCPYCAQEISPLAKKCNHCQEYLDGDLREQKPSGCAWSFAMLLSICLPPAGLLLALILPLASKKDKPLAMPMIVVSLISMLVGVLIVVASR